MAKRRSKLENFQAELAVLQQSISENLRLPSLDDDRLQGFSYLSFLHSPC